MTKGNMEPEVCHPDCYSDEGFSNTYRMVTRDVGPVDVLVVVLVEEECHQPTREKEDLGGDALKSPHRDELPLQSQRPKAIDKEEDRTETREVVVPMVHSVFIRLVRIPNDKKKCDGKNQLGPVVHDYSQHFRVNL